MNKEINILLGKEKHVDSTNNNEFSSVQLENQIDEINEYDIRHTISATEVYDVERQDTNIYRIYGKINYLSLLNGLNNKYKKVNELFTPYYCSGETNCNFRNIFSDFKIYLLKSSTGFTKILNDDITYIRNFEVIATPNELMLYNAGFSKNIYNDQEQAFHFIIDFDISTYFDAFNFPCTDVYLHFEYIPHTNGYNQIETVKTTKWDINTGNELIALHPYQTYNIGDIIYGDKIEYGETIFYQTVVKNQKYYITLPYKEDDGTDKTIEFTYNPFIKIGLRLFSDRINKVNSKTLSYEEKAKIPEYATNIENDTYVWRNILPEGYIDPITNKGYDFPFLNKKRYVFSSIVLPVLPNLENANTLDVFQHIKFDNPTEINIKPINNINNIGKPC